MTSRVVLGGAVAALAMVGIWLLSRFETKTPSPRLPNLEGVESAVAEKMRRLHALVIADPRLENWGLYARTLQAHDMRREARHAYQVASASSSGADRFEYLYLAGHCVVRSAPKEALQRFEQALKLRGDYAPLQLRLGELYEKEGRYDKARYCYEAALGIKESSHALLGLGRLALAEGRPEESLTHLEKAAALAPEHREVYVALAQAYAQAGRTKEAARVASLAGNVAQAYGFPDPIVMRMAQEGVSYTAREQLALANLKNGNFQAALEHINRALAVRPNGSDANFHKGRILASLNRHQEALECFDRVLALQQHHLESMVMKSACLIKLGRSRDALELLVKALKIDPYSLDTHYTLGVLLQKASPQKAKQHLRFVLQKKPQRIDARIALAATLLQERRLGEAEREVHQVLEQDPGNVAARQLLEAISAN